MNRSIEVQTVSFTNKGPTLGPESLARLIDSLHAPTFGHVALGVLRETTGADHCVFYAFENNAPEVLGACSANGSSLAVDNGGQFSMEGFWKRDPAVLRALHGDQKDTFLARVTASHIVDERLRYDFYVRPGIQEKFFFSGYRDGKLYGVSVFRDVRSGAFRDEASARLAHVADTLISCASQRRRLQSRPTLHDPAEAMSSLDRIEQRLGHIADGLPNRELQVLGRLLFGQTLPCIAEALLISPGTVASYRKRAFKRLGIAKRQELLTFFVGAARSAHRA